MKRKYGMTYNNNKGGVCFTLHNIIASLFQYIGSSKRIVSSISLMRFNY